MLLTRTTPVVAGINEPTIRPARQTPPRLAAIRAAADGITAVVAIGRARVRHARGAIRHRMAFHEHLIDTDHLRVRDPFVLSENYRESATAALAIAN